LVNPSGASDTRFKAVLNVRAQSRVLTGDAARFDEFLASLHTHIEASENAAGVPERAQGSDSDQSEENKEDAAFDKWWGQIDAAWPGDKGLLDDHLWEEEPQRRDQRWKQVEAVLEEFAELMGRRAAVEIVCGDFWYLWDDEEPTSLHFIRRKLAEFRKALGGQECLPETRGNEGWYRMRWEGFTGGEGLLEDEHKRLQDAKAWGEEIGHIWHTPTQGYGEGKERLRHLRERENPDEIRASVAAGKPRELRIMFFGAFSRLAEERKQAWQRVKKQLESLNDAAAVTLAEIKRRWDDLLDGLRKDRRSALAAILREAVPVALEGDTLTLSFARKHEFHYTTLCKDEKLLKAASGALKHVFGREIAIKCQLESPNETATAADQPTG
jgi:hypothetical protein